ncbi:lantibiotic dehydratase [Kitasatospora terrestris]
MPSPHAAPHPPLFRPAPVALLRAPARGRDRRPGWARPAVGAATDPWAGLSPAACRDLLRGAAADGPFMDALRVASPSLARLVDAATRPAGLATRTDAQLRRAVVSVLRYELRLRSRSTPFGRFAGVAPVRFGDGGTPVELTWDAPDSTRTRADLDWLFRVIQQLERDPELLPHLTLHAHAGILTRGGRLVMAAPSNPGAGAGDAARSEVSVRLTPAVAAALELCAGGAEFGSVVGELERRFPQAPAGAFAGMLSTLVGQEFLITGLRPVLDGGDPLGRVVDVLADAERAAGTRLPMLAALRSVAADRDRYDAARPAGRTAALAGLEDGMRRLADSDRLVHVDLALGAELHLPPAVAEEAARALGALWRLSPPGPGMPTLRGYHRDFLERYGTDRVVPLLELLDETVGLGAPAGYRWPQSTRSEDPPRPSDRQRDLLLGRLAAEAVRDGRREVLLDDALVDRLAPAGADRARPPHSCELFCALVAADEKALANGEFLLVGGNGPGPAEAGATFGRFAGLAGGVHQELAALLHPEATETGQGTGDGPLELAVAYQPRTTRALNIANSPRTVAHQVSIGLPPDPEATTVPLDRIGVAATTEYLYAVHMPSGRRLRPHAHHALDLHGQAPNAARLLLELGRDAHRSYAAFDWGAAAGAPYLPRVRYGRTVLAPARWRLDELADHVTLPPDRWRDAVADWRRRWRVPRQTVLTRADQRLPVDLAEPWHRELLRDALTKDPDLLAVELPGGEDRPDGWLLDRQGHPHTAELALAFTAARDEPPARPSGRATDRAADRAADRTADRPSGRACGDHAGSRAAEPGGDWLYAKLYLAGRQTEAFLTERLTPCLAALPDDVREVIDRWFYIRYRDPDDHVRLRFHGPAERLWGDLLPRLRTAVCGWTAEGLVGRVVLDSYEPEWERYGGPEAQPAAERFFAADSRTALTLLRVARGTPVTTDGITWDRETLTALSLASIAHAAGMPPGDTSRYREPAAAWLADSAAAGADLPDGFRTRRAHWLRLVDPAGGWPALDLHPAGAAVRAALQDQAAHLHAYRQELDALAARDADWSPLPRVVAGLLHMSCNRLLGPDHEAERRALALARACVLGNADRRRHQA